MFWLSVFGYLFFSLVLFYENRFVTDFTKSAVLCNSLFAKQCSVINTGSSLLFELLLKTDKLLSNITFSRDDILKLIQNLYSEKARHHDRISIQILKICEPSIRKLLETTFKSCLESEIFLHEWKKKHVVPVHKKMANNNQQTTGRYHYIPEKYSIWTPVI